MKREFSETRNALEERLGTLSFDRERLLQEVIKVFFLMSSFSELHHSLLADAAASIFK